MYNQFHTKKMSAAFYLTLKHTRVVVYLDKLGRREFIKLLAASGFGLAMTLTGIDSWRLNSITGGNDNKNSARNIIPQAEAQSVGSWSLGPLTSSVAIHAALLHTGKILYVTGSGYHTGQENGPFQARVLDPSTGTEKQLTTTEDIFCMGLTHLSDGDVLMAGGTLLYDALPENCNGRWHGLRSAHLFDTALETISKVSSMAHGRWYPTLITLPDGKVATFNGNDEFGYGNLLTEVYDPNSDIWSKIFDPGSNSTYTVGGASAGVCEGAGLISYGGPGNGVSPNVGQYPRMHLMPNGLVATSGMGTTARSWNPTTGRWQVIGTMSTSRHYGASILLPLQNSLSEKGKILTTGGSTDSTTPATKSAQILDFNASSGANPVIRTIASMSYARKFQNQVILPDGKILIVGGSGGPGSANAVYAPELFNPLDETWQTLPAATVPRVYHSVALLLPDGRVWTASSTPTRSSAEHRTEIYSPSYYFATRPTISDVVNIGGYGGTIGIDTPDPAGIPLVSLVRLNSTTHHYESNARLIWLPIKSKTSNRIYVNSPLNSNLAPPGYYMLHILNAAGVPSISRIIKIPGNYVDQSTPLLSIISPAAGELISGPSTGVSINVVGATSDSGTGIQTVDIKLGSSSYQSAVPDIPSNWSSWRSTLVASQAGATSIQARATDGSGNTTSITIPITISFV